jgi:conjugal transfer pilus assembly protein TraE
MEYRLRVAGNRNMAVAILVLLIIAILALGLCWRMYSDNRELMAQIVNNRQVIVVPYGADSPFSFTGERGDARYLRLMALAWGNLRLNINSANADASHEMLLAAACDGAETPLQAVLVEEAARVKGNSGGSVFYPKDFQVWPEKGIVDITGQLELSYGMHSGSPVDKHYRIRTDLRNNRLCWSAFLEVPHA